MIGHMKTEGRLWARNWLKGEMGDAIHAVLCGTGHNLRMILAYPRGLLVAFVGWLVMATKFESSSTVSSTAAPN